MINPQRKKLFIGVSYLIWAAWFYRWISVDMSSNWLENRWIIVPMILYGLLLGLDSWLTRGRTWRVLLYLAFQAGLVFLMALQAVDLDYFYLLLLPLVGQAIFLLPRRIAFIVIGAMIVMNGAGLIIINGWPEAISYIVLYNAAIIFTTGYSILMLEADKARRETQQLLSELQEYSEQARQLAVIEERNRLARELHDSVTQALYGLTLQSEAMARKLENGPGRLPPDEMRELSDIAQQALQEMRLMIFELRPTILEQSGLMATLQARLETVENRSGTHAYLADTLNERLPLELESGLYGIAREALNNIAKHAQAQQIDISLAPGPGDNVIFEIADDGVGFDTEDITAGGGLGFRGMRERAEKMDASFSVDSRPSEGTRIRVEVKR